MVKKDRVSGSKYKNPKKFGNEIVKILAKLKSRNLFKFRFKKK